MTKGYQPKYLGVILSDRYYFFLSNQKLSFNTCPVMLQVDVESIKRICFDNIADVNVSMFISWKTIIEPLTSLREIKVFIQ